MDLLDIAIIVVAFAAAAHGARLGAAVQLLTWVGFFAGLVVGSLVLVLVEPHLSGQITKTFVALALLMVLAAVLAGTARQFGFRLGRVLRRVHLRLVDSLGGVLIALAGVLAVCWLFASLLANGAFGLVAREIEGSTVLRGVDAVMPPVPSAFASLERYLSTGGFPQVLVDALPESLGPVSLASRAELRRTVAKDGPSTVKIVALGCGDEQEGSGFAVSKDLYVTNAHVVAGTKDITVLGSDGRSADATVVFFDPRFDLAVLRTIRLGIPPLTIDHGYVADGAPAVVLGYPEGGPFDAREAGVVTRFRAEGRDIYDDALTTRTVYQLQAIVRPGNSGGPVISSNGEVVGVVFSRSASNPDIGYALASPGVAERVETASASTTPVSTDGCTG